MPSENIPATYAYLYQTMGLMLAKTEQQAAMKMLTLADSMVKNTSYGRPGGR